MDNKRLARLRGVRRRKRMRKGFACEALARKMVLIRARGGGRDKK